MSKFRSRQLDASKPIPIFYQEDIFDSTEFNNVTNRSVPQLPTGMEKEEETEHHLQQAIFHHRVIPVPEVYDITLSNNSKITYDHLYPPNYKALRQLIHIHPFSTDQDIPDYDLDSEDEEWLQEHARKGELLPLAASQFEEMMDRLEKTSGLKAVTLQEAKLLLKDDDDLITTVYDYWLNKRLVLQHPLIPQVKSEKGAGCSPTDPYVAFRKRTEKMQTRKNRKNDESSYEKMLKLRRDLARALTLLEMLKRREKSKREYLHLNIEIHEKRNEVEDFSGSILSEVTSQKLLQSLRPAFAPITPNHQLSSGLCSSEYEEGDGETLGNNSWLKVPPLSRPKGKRRFIGPHGWVQVFGIFMHGLSAKAFAEGNAKRSVWLKEKAEEAAYRLEEGRRERRPYKKKKRNQHIVGISSASGSHLPRSYTHTPDSYSISSNFTQVGSTNSGVTEEDVASTSFSEAEDETSLDGYFAFKRNAHITYLAAQDPPILGEESPPQQYSLTSLSHDKFIGFARRRVGRGGRILLDRIMYPASDRKIKSENKDSGPGSPKSSCDLVSNVKKEWPHFHPSSTVSADSSEDSEDVEVDVETVCGVSSLISPSPVGNESNLEDKRAGGGDSSIPSTFYITAEMLEGSQEGAFTQLQVTLPPHEELDFLAESSSISGASILLEENNLEEIDFVSTNTSIGSSGSVCGSSKVNDVISSQNDSLTSGNNVINSYFQSDSPLRDKESKSSVNNCSKWPSGSSKKSSVTVNSSHQHSIFDFQTQPTSKFSTLDNYLSSNNQCVNRQLSQQSSSGEELQKLGISPLSNCSPSNSWQPPCNSFSSSPFVNMSDISSSQTSTSLLSSSIASPLTTSSSSSSSLLSKTISVSSSLANSLNSYYCASQNLSLKKNCENSNSQELSTKKLMNLSSIYIRQPKDSLQLETKPSGFLLSNNRNNGNNVLNNSSSKSSNLVPQKFLNSWTTSESLSNDDNSSIMTNGPGTKTLENLKCTKVAPILFHDT